MTNLQTTYLGLSLAHPIVAGASPLSATLDGMRRLEDAGAAAIVTRSFFEEEVTAEEEALDFTRTIGAESHPEVTSYLPALSGFRWPQVARIETVRRAAEGLSVPVIASMSATTGERWVELASALQEAGAAALELNLFDVPTDPQKTSSAVEERLVEVVKNVCGTVSVPVAVKLGPYFSAPVHLARLFADAGAGGIVLFNRFYEPDIDLQKMAFRPTLALSTKDDVRRPLRWIALLSGRTPLGLAASGGVEAADEVVKYLLAGADVVQTASALLRHGPQHLHQLVNGLAEWLGAHDAVSVTDIRGRMSAQRMSWPEELMCGQPKRRLLMEFPCQDSAAG